VIRAIAIAALAILTPAVEALQVTELGGQEDTSEGTVTFTLVASEEYAISLTNMRRGLVGGTLSRAWISLTQNGTQYVVSFDHNGSRADPTVWSPQCAGATHGYAVLGAGTITAENVAAAAETALELLGVTGVSVVGAVLTVEDAGNKLIGTPMVYDTSTRGMWGEHRDSFGTASTANANGNMGGTGSVHVDGPASAGRILGAYMRAGGSANVRLGVADGPAYSTTPAAFSGGSEAVGVRGAVDTTLVLALFDDPQEMDAAADKWVSFRGRVGGDPTLRYRNHASTPEGDGDLTASEQLLFSTTEDNPAVAIYTAGAYTHGAEAGPYSIYAFVGFVYEVPDGNGEYPGDGGIESALGTHATATAGGPTATVAADMDAETFGMRHLIPWDCDVVAVDVSVAAYAADEDLGMAFYEFADIPAPTVLGATLLRDVGPYGLSGTGYQRHTLATPLSVTAGTILGVMWNAGNEDGTTPTDTISVNYDPDTGAAEYWSTAWIDDGRTWNDMDPTGNEDGYGQETEYRTRAAFGGQMPEGDPSAAWPDPFAEDASDDHSVRNHLRHRIYLSRAGIT
jgi:hypothetical protein